MKNLFLFIILLAAVLAGLYFTHTPSREIIDGLIAGDKSDKDKGTEMKPGGNVSTLFANAPTQNNPGETAGIFGAETTPAAPAGEAPAAGTAEQPAFAATSPDDQLDLSGVEVPTTDPALEEEKTSDNAASVFTDGEPPSTETAPEKTAPAAPSKGNALDQWMVGLDIAKEFPPVAAAYKSFKNKLKSHYIACNKDVQNLNTLYAKNLTSRLNKYKQEGNLEELVALKNEKERFAKAQRVTEEDYVDEALNAGWMQRKYKDTWGKMILDRREKLREIIKTHITKLDNVKKQYTRAEKIDEAIKVNEARTAFIESEPFKTLMQ